MKIYKLWVSVGDHDARRQDSHERVIQADKIIIHKYYNPNNFHNDIGKSFIRSIAKYKQKKLHFDLDFYYQ